MSLVKKAKESVLLFLSSLPPSLPPSLPRVCSYTAEVFGVWRVLDGEASLLHMSELEPALPMVSINWKRTVNLALQLRKACYLPPSAQYTVRAFSNHNVYAGEKNTIFGCHNNNIIIQFGIIQK